MQETPQESVQDAPEQSVEKKWAEVLGMEYDESKVPQPPVYKQPGASGPQFVQVNQPPPQYQWHAQGPDYDEPMPPTYLVWSILSVILCCGIPGVVAIVYSALVSTRYYARDYAGARKASERAQLWIIIAIVFGVLSSIFSLPMMLMAGM